jgi:hypothetical protein
MLVALLENAAGAMLFGPPHLFYGRWDVRHRGLMLRSSQIRCNEIDIWHTYSDFYSYEFFVMRAR